LTAGLALTFAATYYAGRGLRDRMASEFDVRAQNAEAALHTKMESYLALLRGGSALMSADPGISSAQFAIYVDRLRIPEFYPGIQGLGFTKKLTPEEVVPHVQSMREQGKTNFSVWPPGPRPEYHAISYLEPQDRRNQAALGYDMFSEDVRRAAMTTARDSGSPAVSGKVTLVQEIDPAKQAGFLIYVPVYREGSVPNNEETRRQSLLGFIYSPFRADDLFNAALGPPSALGLSRRIYDGAPNPGNLLHQAVLPSAWKISWLHPRIEKTVLFETEKHQWTVQLWQVAGDASLWAVPLVLFVGMGLSLLLFRLTWAEAVAREQAEENAARLRVSEQSLRAAQKQLQEYTNRLEQKVLERTALLRDSVQSLEGVLYHVAHDLRAPLRAMASLTTILEEDYSDRLDARGTDYIRRIGQAARRMDDLVKDLLAYGQLSHIELPSAQVDLDKMVKDVLASFSAQIQERQAKVHVEHPLPMVQANPTAVEKVLAHLVSNALKFVPDERQPQIRIWTETNHMVRLWVEDNGSGIKPEYHDRIFQVFERLHGGETLPGTGIGLAIVRKGVERMGGAVGVQSEPDQGSRFWVEFPPFRPDNGTPVR
jgi:signal transduction histidine kinase